MILHWNPFASSSGLNCSVIPKCYKMFQIEFGPLSVFFACTVRLCQNPMDSLKGLDGCESSFEPQNMQWSLCQPRHNTKHLGIHFFESIVGICNMSRSEKKQSGFSESSWKVSWGFPALLTVDFGTALSDHQRPALPRCCMYCRMAVFAASIASWSIS